MALNDSIHATIKQEEDMRHLNSEKKNYEQITEEYEKTIATQVSLLKSQSTDLEEVRQNLATLETAFSDVIQKYERTKKIVEAYKNNESTFQQSLIASAERLKKLEEKYESIKTHAKSQIEECNKENHLMREDYDQEITKLNAVIRRQEIKITSLEELIEQKTKECSALAALCDEVTGKRM